VTRWRDALCCLLLAGGSLAHAGPPALPGWQSLAFEQRAFGVTAHSRVEMDRGEDGSWSLRATSSVADNTETVTLSLAPSSGALLSRTRFSSGKDQRFKSYSYRADRVVRERREPGDDPEAPPAQWPVSSRREIPIPAAAAGRVITDAYALLPLAERFQRSDLESTEVVVHTDVNFYRVLMARAPGETVEVDFRVEGSGERVTGRRETRAVTLRATALGEPREKPDFSLLGLHGEITLQFDLDGGLLLQLRGRAPRIGARTISLSAAMFREPEV
jgi:hypothetical protein